MTTGGAGTTPTAVILMAYGTPRSRDDIERYYTDIRRGRPPTPEQLADLTARYDSLGGTSPFSARTDAQRVALQRALDELEPGAYTVILGLKHADPTIEDSVGAAASTGCRHAVGLVLAPHYSAASVGEYLERARAAAEPAGLTFTGIESWATEPAFVDFVAREVAGRRGAMPADTKVLFTAHSLPQRVIDAGDRYPDELRATAEAVASAAGLGHWSEWAVGWQSAGRTPEPWLGPDVLQVIDELAASEHDAGGPRGLLVSAVGFVADHLEVLYDLDIQAARRAAEHGIVFDRTACVNDDPVVMAALARRVVEAAGR
jgi:ferrochelatase